MTLFKVGDRVVCYKGGGIVISVIRCGLFRTVYYVAIDNGGHEFFTRWHLKKEKTEAIHECSK
jgi:hypothetical protein